MKAYKHVVDYFDGHKVPPKWVNRARHFGHLVYYGTVTFGLWDVHQYVVGGVFCLECLAVVLASESLRDAVLEFEV